MQTATSPLARAKMRAQGVMGHLKRLLSNQVPGFDDTRAEPPSPQLARAMASAQHSEQAAAQATLLAGAQAQVYAQVHVDQAVGNLRRRTTALKEAASTNTEKATIEIVALMFQAILAEDRIPAGVRVWFARLQMPVLRVAMAAAVAWSAVYRFFTLFATQPWLQGLNPSLYFNVARLVQFWM